MTRAYKKSLAYQKELTIWSAKAIETLREQAATGKTSTQIAQMSKALFGRTYTRSAICGAAMRNGIEFTGRQPRINVAKLAEAAAKKPPPPPPPPPPKKKKTGLAHLKANAPKNEPEAIGPLNTVPDNGCKWVHGDPSVRGWRCCGQPRHALHPYCMHHVARAGSVPVYRSPTTPSYSRQGAQKRMAARGRGE